MKRARRTTAGPPTGSEPRAKRVAKAPSVRRRPPAAGAKSVEWELRLYVAGQTPRCVEAFANLKRICEVHLEGRYRIDVIDLLENPTLARGDQILAIPTLVRKLPTPMKKVIGDLSNEERVLVGLNLRPVASSSTTRRARGDV